MDFLTGPTRLLKRKLLLRPWLSLMLQHFSMATMVSGPPPGHSEKYVDILAGLSELEDTFATAFESLDRPDLAALVRGGKKYQRIPFVVGSDFSILPNLFLAFRQLVLGKDSNPTFEKWKKEAWEKYKGHPFLALKMMT